MPDAHSDPTYYNDLDKTHAEAWRLLVRGVKDRRSGFHTMTVGTAGRDGFARLRTVVLRGVETLSRTVRFHTDARSPKIQEINANSCVSVLLYDPKCKVQIRLMGQATIHADDATKRDAWAATRDFSRECYRVVAAPGDPIGDPASVAFDPPGEDGERGADVFRAVTVRADTLEWLYLAHQGHRRAHFAYDMAGTLTAQTWLVP